MSGVVNWNGNGSAYAPNAWSGFTLEPGDMALIASGTLDVPGGTLDGDILTNENGESYTVNLSDGASIVYDPDPAESPTTVTFNIEGADSLEINNTANENQPQPVNVTINIDADSTLALTQMSLVGSLTINGGNLSLAGTENFTGETGDITFNTSISGTAIIDVGNDDSTVTLNGPVAAGININVTSITNGLIIDQPANFDGTIDIDAGPIRSVGNSDENVLLAGLAANGYTYANGSLSLYENGQLVDTLKLTNEASSTALTNLTLEQNADGVVITSVGSLPYGGNGTIIQPEPVQTAPAPQNNFLLSDQTTGVTGQQAGTPYSGPVAGLTDEFILVTRDNVNVTGETPASFISLDGGTGEDAIQVASGNNVLNGSTGSSFLFGGSGNDTFFVDDRSPTADIWSTVAGMHAGDQATIWGITPAMFNINMVDGLGATGYSGLTIEATKQGQPSALLTLAGYSTADVASGKLSISYGTTSTTDGIAGSTYMLITAH